MYLMKIRMLDALFLLTKLRLCTRVCNTNISSHGTITYHFQIWHIILKIYNNRDFEQYHLITSRLLKLSFLFQRITMTRIPYAHSLYKYVLIY